MSRHYAMKAKYGPWCRFGGDSRSDSSTDTANYTTNNANSWDKRAVASDSAVSLTGDGNWLDRSSTSNFMDVSNRSSNFNDLSNRSSNFSDASNRSSNFTDNSNRSSNFTDSSRVYDSSDKRTDSSSNFTDNSNRSVNNTVTDFGAVSSAMAGMTAATTRAFDLSGAVVNSSQAIMKQSMADQQSSLNTALTLASRANSTATQTSADVIGFATTAIKEARGAFAEADDGGQSKMVIAALVVVAAVGVAFALKL